MESESMVKKLFKLKQKLRFGSSSKKNEEKLFLENGSIFLKKLLVDCNDKSIPICNFSSSQILKATNDFDLSYLLNPLPSDSKPMSINGWYKGIIEDKPYLIKRFLDNEIGDVFNDIVLSARMSNHINFLKLLGYCFEFSSPVALFEYEEQAILNPEGRIEVNREESTLPWSVRLKIAKEVATAITYLHTAFPKIIVHKDIKPTNIFLDKNSKAKLTNFKFSVSLPQGKSRIEDTKVIGTFGFVDPIYLATSSLSEYTDVYSFGVTLLVFFTGRPAFDFYEEPKSNRDRQTIVSYVKGLYENGKLYEVIDPMIAKDLTSVQRLQVEAFVVLALRCCEKKEEDRPKMIQVAKELKRIERIEHSLDASFAIEFPKNETLEDGFKYDQLDKEIQIQD